MVPPGAGTTIGTSLGIALSGAVSGVLMARLLSPSDRGIVAVSFVWIGLLSQLVDCGLPQAIAYFAAKDPGSAPVSVGRSLTALGPQSVVAIGLGLALRGDLISADAARSLVIVAVAAIPAILGHSYIVGVMRGLQRYRLLNLLRALPVGLWFASVLVCYLADIDSPTTLVVAYVLALWVSVAVASVLLLREVGDPQFGIRGAMALLRYGLLVWVSGVGHQTNARIDQFMLGALASSAALGVYAVAVGLASALGVVSLAIGMVTLPQVAAASAVTRGSVVRRNVGLTLAASTALALLGVVLAPVVVSTLLGTGYGSVVVLLRVLLFAQIALSGSHVLEEVFRGVGRPGTPAIIEGVGTVVTLVALSVTIPEHGAIAAAWTSLVVYWLVFLALGVLARPAVRRSVHMDTTAEHLELST